MEKQKFLDEEQEEQEEEEKKKKEEEEQEEREQYIYLNEEKKTTGKSELALRLLKEKEETEKKDEKQIEESMKGRVIEEYAYQFKVGGKVVTGLSYSGVMAAVRKQGNVKVLKVDFTETKDHYRSEATVRDEAKNIEVKGFAMQRKFYPGGMPDEFAFVKACMKAQRNGLRKVIDEAVGKVILEEALKKLRQKKEDAKAFMV